MNEERQKQLETWFKCHPHTDAKDDQLKFVTMLYTGSEEFCERSLVRDLEIIRKGISAELDATLYWRIEPIWRNHNRTLRARVSIPGADWTQIVLPYPDEHQTKKD